jgi:ABC-type nitrate/sulfonate/bicarbonate transport system substrate-binding protein
MKECLKSKISLFLSLIVMLSLIISGCSNNDSNNTQNNDAQGGENQNLKQVIVALDWVPNTNHTGLYVAIENGYYKDSGLDVIITQPPENGSVPLVSTQKAQFGISFQDEMAPALAAEAPLDVVAIASIIDHNLSGLVSLKKESIETPKDLEGKRYATWDTPLEKSIISEIIKADGGDPEKLTYVSNTATDAISALRTDIDVVWIFYAWDGISAEVKGVDTNYLDFRKLNPIFDYYTPVVITSQAYIDSNQDTVKKFLTATAKGYEFAIENPEEAAGILVKHAPETDPEIAKASQIYLAAQYQAEKPVWGVIDKERWSAFYDWLYAQGIITQKLGSKGFTNDFLLATES